MGVYVLMTPYHCKHCGALVAIVARSAIFQDTRLRCGSCNRVFTIVQRVAAQAERESNSATEQACAEARTNSE